MNLNRILMPTISSGGRRNNREENDEEELIRLLPDGQLFLPRSSVYVALDDYCLEQCMPSQNFVAILCMPLHALDTSPCGFRQITYTVAMAISALSLAAIVLVYVLIPDLRNAPGRVLLAHVTALMVAYAVLVSIRLGRAETWPRWLCVSAGTK